MRTPAQMAARVSAKINEEYIDMRLLSHVKVILRAIKRIKEINLQDQWNLIDTAPKDGTAFLAYGRHTHSPEDAQRGVAAGDHWWGIILWDTWREPAQWVFAKDGAPAWSDPTHWMPLLPPTPAKSTTKEEPQK